MNSLLQCHLPALERTVDAGAQRRSQRRERPLRLEGGPYGRGELRELGGCDANVHRGSSKEL